MADQNRYFQAGVYVRDPNNPAVGVLRGSWSLPVNQQRARLSKLDAMNELNKIIQGVAIEIAQNTAKQTTADIAFLLAVFENGAWRTYPLVQSNLTEEMARMARDPN